MGRTYKDAAAAHRKRERDVFLLYGPAFRDIPLVDNPSDQDASPHVPRASPDSTLTALAQLAATRLHAQRALISLIDDKRQHILAEATPTSSLEASRPGAASDLWLGTVSIPKSYGLCELVLEHSLASESSAPVIIDDLSQVEHHAERDYVRDGPRMRFYAGAPLISPSGSVVGAVSIFDDQPRQGFREEQAVLFQDFAATITTYLHTYAIREQYQRGEQFTRGLLSFAQGASALKPFKVFSDDNSFGSDASSRSVKMSLHSSSGSKTILPQSSSRERSIGTLQNSILPPHSRDMFSRAANLMMASSNLDGVLMLDAAVAASHSRQFPGGAEDEDSGDSSHSKSSSSDEGSLKSESGSQDESAANPPKACSVLGYAIQRRPNSDGEVVEVTQIGSLRENELARLLKDLPNGKIVNYTASGQSTSSTEGSNPSDSGSLEESAADPKRKHSGRRFQSSKAIQAMLPGARSVAFVPFWDYERSRWFAGCLCWSNSPQRMLSPTVDLAYFKIFGNSIMRELSRLDAMASHQAKTTFIASISHELRSPLHGILGTLEFIKDTNLDSFQSSMLNALNSCAQTLLDTINQVMDYAKSNESSKTISSKKLKSTNTVRLSSKPLKTRKIKQAAFDLALATEEVIEAIFSASSYTPVLGNRTMTSSTPGELEFDPMAALEPSSKRKTCYIVLDISQEEDWVHCFTIGSWKRLVMNLFGNALKYTQSGHVQIALRASPSTQENDPTGTTVTLIIKDSGVGMSPSFLANKAFQPFSQENPHSTGVGLGLSIVRQIIETSGGKMEVNSEPSVGTSFAIKLALTKPDNSFTPSPQRLEFQSWVTRLAGTRVCILNKRHTSPSDQSDATQNTDGLSRFTNGLVATLETHLKLKVIQTEDWVGQDSTIVICPEPSFEDLENIRCRSSQKERAPVTIFVAMDALEAMTFQSDVRVKDKESVVEVITQPCGPYKLAYILNRCLDRLDNPDENIRPSTSGGSSPHPNLQPLRSTLQDFLPVRSRPITPLADSVPPEKGEDNISTVEIVSSKENSPIEAPVPKPVPQNPSRPHVLITDDNIINRKLLVAFMNKQQLPYSEAENGLQALQAYQDPAIRFDFILMDMSMPVMDGMTATRAIRQYEQTYNVPRCCIIALTGLASASAKLEAWNSGIDQYMMKPVNFKLLGKVLGDEERRRKSVDVGGIEIGVEKEG